MRNSNTSIKELLYLKTYPEVIISLLEYNSKLVE